MKTLRSYWNLIVPVLSVAAAIFAGTRAAPSGNSPTGWLVPAVAFFVTMVVTRKLLHGEFNGFPEVSLIDKRSLTELDRALPLLVNRLFQAGYAPIFVVDELDKVPDLADRLRGFMRQLKYFATDESFFCFLTDRSYFEVFEADLDHWRYPVEQTYFGHRVLVHYTPAQIRKYIDSRFPPNDQGPETLTIKNIIAFVSHCQPAEVERYLSENRDPADPRSLRIEEGTLWSAPKYRFSIYCNTVLQFLYESSDATHRIRQYPQFSAWIMDSLYYLPQGWLDGQSPDVDQQRLKKYFKEHLGLGRLDRDVTSDADLAFLLDLTLKFRNHLISPHRFAQEWVESHKSTLSREESIQLVNCLLQRPLIRMVPNKDRGKLSSDAQCSWEFDFYGTPIRPDGSLRPYFGAIRSNSFERTMEKTYDRTDYFQQALTNLGVSAEAIFQMASDHAWGKDSRDWVRSALKPHKAAVESLFAESSGRDVNHLFDMAAMSITLFDAQGRFLIAALAGKSAVADIDDVDECIDLAMTKYGNDEVTRFLLEDVLSGGTLQLNLDALNNLAKKRPSAA